MFTHTKIQKQFQEAKPTKLGKEEKAELRDKGLNDQQLEAAEKLGLNYNDLIEIIVNGEYSLDSKSITEGNIVLEAKKKGVSPIEAIGIEIEYKQEQVEAIGKVITGEKSEHIDPGYRVGIDIGNADELNRLNKEILELEERRIQLEAVSIAGNFNYKAASNISSTVEDTREMIRDRIFFKDGNDEESKTPEYTGTLLIQQNLRLMGYEIGNTGYGGADGDLVGGDDHLTANAIVKFAAKDKQLGHKVAQQLANEFNSIEGIEGVKVPEIKGASKIRE